MRLGHERTWGDDSMEDALSAIISLAAVSLC